VRGALRNALRNAGQWPTNDKSGQGPRALVSRGLMTWKRPVLVSVSRSRVRVCIRLLTAPDFCKADHSQIQPGHWAAGEGRRQARDVFRPEKLSEAQLRRILTKYAAYYNNRSEESQSATEPRQSSRRVATDIYGLLASTMLYPLPNTKTFDVRQMMRSKSTMVRMRSRNFQSNRC
jgi:hypothetical protein